MKRKPQANTVNWIREDDKHVRRAAERGNAYASYEYAQRLMVGRGSIERDPYAAFAECEYAAKRGVVGAQNMLGFCYAQGVGVVANGKKALEAFTQAARRGSVVAQYNLAICCEQGIGMAAPKPELAAAFMERAAEAGYSRARIACARRQLLKGSSVEERAHGLRNLVKEAKRGNREALAFLTACLDSRKAA